MLGPTKAFQCDRVDDVLIVSPKGDERGLSYADIQRESNSIHHLLDHPDLSNVVFDLSRIRMVGSILIGILFRIARKAESQGGSFICCCADQDVQDTLTNVNLLGLWPHFDSREEALESFSQPVNNSQ